MFFSLTEIGDFLDASDASELFAMFSDTNEMNHRCEKQMQGQCVSGSCCCSSFEHSSHDIPNGFVFLK